MAILTKTDIKAEAKTIIKNIFSALLSCDNKEKWKGAFNFIDTKIEELENGDRGLQMFAWREVKKMLNTRFGKNFITK